MYDELSQLFGGYLHQDFDLEHDSPDAAVRDYATSGPQDAVRAVRDIDALVAEGLPESRLREQVFKLGCDYYFVADGYTAYGWLAHVRDLLTTEVDRLVGFTVHVGLEKLDRTESGAVTGPIWVRTGGADFPETGWTDFPVVLLTGWLSEFVTAVDRGRSGPGVVSLPFMEGPYTLHLVRDADLDHWTVTRHGPEGDAAGAVGVGGTTVLEGLWHPARALVAACRSYGWADDDIDGLTATLSVLEARGRIRG